MSIISIIIPCFNEQKTIGSLLDAISRQTIPGSTYEVVIADGMSTDGTRRVIGDFAASHPEIRIQVIDNPKRIIPAALNSAIRNSSGEVIIRLDAHCCPYPDYLERCLQDLQAELGDNVGGVWEIHPGGDTWIAKSIAVAASHKLGVGDALYRHTLQPAAVDTVPFGAFKRELLAQVGFFNEKLLTNEDYEFNARIRKMGGVVWLDPAIRSIYYSRATLPDLARQYFRYGFWKWRMLLHNPGTLRLRQFLPPFLVFTLVVFFLAGLFFPFLLIFFALELLLYLLTLLAAGIHAAIRQKMVSLVAGLPLAISTMHLSWGAGFLWSMIKAIFSRLPMEKE